MWNHLAIFTDIGKWFADIGKLIDLYPFFDLPISGSDEKMSIFYNMVGRALFLQRALYTVHCTNTMHSRKPSFAIIPAVFSQHCKSLFCNICGNEIRHILLKQFNLNYPWYKHYQTSMYKPMYIRKSRYVRAPIRRFQNDISPIRVRSQLRSLCCYCDVTELNGIVTLLLT